MTASKERLLREMTAAQGVTAAPPQATGRDWFRIANAVGRTAEVLIFDYIGFFGVEAEAFVREVGALDVDEITVRINSPGGSVFDGWAIYNALQSHPAKVTTIVEGLAASAASFIAQAGDRRIMRKASQMMIHNAWGVCQGPASDMREMADRLERLSATIAGIYASRSGGPQAPWIEAMNDETWFSPDEAVTAGLADTVDDPAKDDATTNHFDLSIFNYAGRPNAPAPHIAASSRQAEDNRKEGTMPNLKDGLRQRLGLAENQVDDDTVLAALDEALNERASDETPPTAVAELSADALAAAAANHGLAVVDQDTFTEVRRQAAEGAALAKQMANQDRERTVDAAISTGRIAASSREVWLNKLEADPSEADVLNGFPAGTIPVGEIGHNGDAVGTTNNADDDLSWV